jgi:hypothetical protein
MNNDHKVDNQQLNIYKYNIFINIIGTLENIGIKLSVFAALKEHCCIFCHSFVCLRCVIPVSMHYRLCIVTVHMKVLQIGDLLHFQKGQIVGVHLAGASVNKSANLLGVSRAAVSRVMTAYTNYY